VKDGVVFLFGDLHAGYAYVEPPTALRALCKLAATLKPRAIVNIGDSVDAASISRFPRNGWEHRPTMAGEIERAQTLLGLIEDASPGVPKFHCIGNHDTRIDSYLSSHADAFENLLPDFQSFFPAWKMCWSLLINPGSDGLMCLHKFRGGTGAARNNIVNAGLHIATGHTHRLSLCTVSNYAGSKHGIETGMLADDGPFSNYTLATPKDWRSGFVVVTFRDGVLLQPELVTKWDENSACWRGKIVEV
jgi:hypothetical protein